MRAGPRYQARIHVIKFCIHIGALAFSMLLGTSAATGDEPHRHPTTESTIQELFVASEAGTLSTARLADGLLRLTFLSTPIPEDLLRSVKTASTTMGMVSSTAPMRAVKMPLTMTNQIQNHQAEEVEAEAEVRLLKLRRPQKQSL